MFYMGGMTLGYLSPKPTQTDEGDANKGDTAPRETSIRMSLLKPAVPQKPRPQHTAWPIHVLY